MILIFYFYSTALYRTWAQYARTTSDRDIRVFSCLEYTLRAGTAFHRRAKYIVTLIHALFQVTISTGGSVRYILSYLSSPVFPSPSPASYLLQMTSKGIKLDPGIDQDLCSTRRFSKKVVMTNCSQ